MNGRGRALSTFENLKSWMDEQVSYYISKSECEDKQKEQNNINLDNENNKKEWGNINFDPFGEAKVAKTLIESNKQDNNIENMNSNDEKLKFNSNGSQENQFKLNNNLSNEQNNESEKNENKNEQEPIKELNLEDTIP